MTDHALDTRHAVTGQDPQGELPGDDLEVFHRKSSRRLDLVPVDLFVHGFFRVQVGQRPQAHDYEGLHGIDSLR